MNSDEKKVLGKILTAFLLIVKLLRFLIGRKKKKKSH
ncbi:hypothetical protein ES703_36558 [subsurface metagenome]